jgi:hypothetical protein
MRITYDHTIKDQVIKSLGLKKNEDGFLVYVKTNEPILDDDMQQIKYKQFAGVKKGSIHYYKSDLPSLIALSKMIRDK